MVKKIKNRERGSKKLKKLNHLIVNLVENIDKRLDKDVNRFKKSKFNPTKIDFNGDVESKFIYLTGNENSRYLNLSSLKCKALMVENRIEMNYINSLLKDKNYICNFNFNSPTPATGPLNLWSKSAINRFRNGDNIFLIDLDHLILSKKMTISEILETIQNLTSNIAEVFLVNFKKFKSGHGNSNDSFLLEIIKSFEVISLIEVDNTLIKLIIRGKVS